MVEDITDPIQGISYCNKHIQSVEDIIEKAKEKGDLATAIKGEGWLVQWTEQLQHFIRMKWQEKLGTEDISRSAKKKRFNG